MIEVANRHGIHPVTLAKWKRQMSDKNPKMNHDQAELIAETKNRKDEIKRLKKIIADLSVDKEILNEAIAIYQEIEKKEKSK
jgi:transposase-like protein